MAGSALRKRLSKLPESERLGALVTLVQEVVAAVLGLAGPAAVPAKQPLKELGLDSLMALEVRNQLSALAETTLPATLVFDYPTPEAIAKLLLEQAFARARCEHRGGAHARRTSDEPIAILAMACRTPGGVEDPEGYWALLDEGRDVVGPFPARWDVDALYDPDPEASGQELRARRRVPARCGSVRCGLLRHLAARSGGDGPAAAAGAGGGVGGAGACGAETGCAERNEHGRVSRRRWAATTAHAGAALEALDGYVGDGQASSVLSGRVSYVLGLAGPGDDGGHGVFVVAGGAASGVCGRCGRASATWRWPAACR